MSAEIGSDRTLIQGAGGNTSLKGHGGELWVKASGVWLADATQDRVFVALDRAAVLRCVAGGVEPGPGTRLVRDETLRPSIEATLHAVLPQRVVLHVHSVNAIAHAVRRDAAGVVAGRLAGLDWAWVPYARPGLPLTRAAQAAMTGMPEVLLLQNHGLVVAAEDVGRAAALLAEVEARLAVPARAAPPADEDRLAQLAAASQGAYRPAMPAEAHWGATDLDSLRLARRGALYPDHVVFLGASPMPILASPDGMAAVLSAMPPCVLVPGAGALVKAGGGHAVDEMLACFGLVAARLSPDWSVRTLTRGQEAELLGWEAERYRRSLGRQPS
ncbi:class II aldolase [Belnapia sp. T18]|uniref:Class II aldolase n=1 Tax=Belnapia arida TaxID=2804533 RepID=A0ABS1U8S8_9PROT|nr:class II aldolase/adducin family protein [Belnapia arida]MBL6081093.1 class II aldolase [Belnapia arida]